MLTRVETIVKQTSSVVETEWRALTIHEADSAQTTKEFAKLARFGSQIEDKEIQEDVTQLNRLNYAEMLAPFDTNEDFSTCSVQRDKGNNLTTERLMKLTPE
jgi:hypothetical protein